MSRKVLSFVLLTNVVLPGAEPLRPTIQKLVTFHRLEDPGVPASLRHAGTSTPSSDITTISTSPDGTVWLGTHSGMISWNRAAGPRDRVQYYAGRRYLPDDEVVGIEAGSGEVWVRTKTGVSRIELKPMTLAQKAAYFEERIRKRHDRHGMVADSNFRVAGDPASNQTVSSDNDGLWTAMYGVAKCYEYAVTKSPEALERARRAVEAVLYLEEITGRPGFPARSYITANEVKPRDGVWYKTADGSKEWKADTSSDEIVGHFYLFAVAHDLLPEAALRERIAATARRIMDHILEHGYYLVDVTGKPTRWGRWTREYFETPDGKPDSPLNALELLSFLKTTHHITGDSKYQREYVKVADDLKYAEQTTKYLELREELNYSDEELAMLSFYPLFLYEKDERYLTPYRRALDQWWENCRRELNPLWTFIYLTGKPDAAVDVEGAVWTLYRTPMDLIKWTVKNSGRADVELAQEKDRQQRQESKNLLPPDERPVMKWNSNPFRVDGGCGGCGEDDGAFFLLPYWMGRHHRYLAGE